MTEAAASAVAASLRLASVLGFLELVDTNGRHRRGDRGSCHPDAAARLVGGARRLRERSAPGSSGPRRADRCSSDGRDRRWSRRSGGRCCDGLGPGPDDRRGGRLGRSLIGMTGGDAPHTRVSSGVLPRRRPPADPWCVGGSSLDGATRQRFASGGAALAAVARGSASSVVSTVGGKGDPAALPSHRVRRHPRSRRAPLLSSKDAQPVRHVAAEPTADLTPPRATLGSQRQPDRHRRPVARLARDGDRPAVGLGEGLRDRQPEAGAA